MIRRVPLVPAEGDPAAAPACLVSPPIGPRAPGQAPPDAAAPLKQGARRAKVAVSMTRAGVHQSEWRAPTQRHQQQPQHGRLRVVQPAWSQRASHARGPKPCPWTAPPQARQTRAPQPPRDSTTRPSARQLQKARATACARLRLLVNVAATATLQLAVSERRQASAVRAVRSTRPLPQPRRQHRPPQVVSMGGPPRRRTAHSLQRRAAQ